MVIWSQVDVGLPNRLHPCQLIHAIAVWVAIYNRADVVVAVARDVAVDVAVAVPQVMAQEVVTHPHSNHRRETKAQGE